MRQAGVLAAAGIYALQKNVTRLAEDHENARALAQALNSVDEVRIDYGTAQTNMVYMGVEPTLAEPLRQFLGQRGILIGAGHTIRLVTHLDLDRQDVLTAATAVKDFFARGTAARTAA
jgi:threonine aldolase